MQHASDLFAWLNDSVRVLFLALFLLPVTATGQGVPPLWQTEVISLISHQRYQEAGETLKYYCVEQGHAELCLMLASAFFEGQSQLGILRRDIIEAYRYTKLACDHGSVPGCHAYRAAIDKGELLGYVLFEPGIDNRDAQLKDAIELGADLNATTLLTATLLQKAISEEREAAVRLLLENGVDVNYRVSEADPTPLMYAINTGNPEMVTMLLDKGADVTPVMQIPAGMNVGTGSMDACGLANQLQQTEIIGLLRCGDGKTPIE